MDDDPRGAWEAAAVEGTGRRGTPDGPVEDWLSGNVALRRLADANVIGVVAGEDDDVLAAERALGRGPASPAARACAGRGRRA